MRACASLTDEVVKRQQPSGPTVNCPSVRGPALTNESVTPSLYWIGDRSRATLSGRYAGDMNIGMTDEALELVRKKGGTAAVDYIHAIG